MASFWLETTIDASVEVVFLEGYMERLIAERNAVLKAEAEARS